MNLEKNKYQISVFLLVSSYLAAMIMVKGLGQNWFLHLTPFSLLLAAALAIWNHPDKSRGFWLYWLSAYLIGYFVELVGVQTGLLFGDYHYGDVLGWKLGGTPLLIGVNWALVVFAGNAVVQRFLPPAAPKALQIALGAAIPVLLDILIEPVAIRYGMWLWQDGDPPLHNFFGWYVVALLISAIYRASIGRETNPIAVLILALQMIFFLILNL